MALGPNLKFKSAKVFYDANFICGSAVRQGVAENGMTNLTTS
jgi:hypothetical protein